MLNETSIAGIRALMHLVLRKSNEPIPPHRIAEALGLSPSYMAKITGALVKGEILRSQRGAKGGVTLRRHATDITLRQIVEACQGKILGSYCEETPSLRQVCAFHRAMVELHNTTTEVLGRWTLADLTARPRPSPALSKRLACRMEQAR